MRKRVYACMGEYAKACTFMRLALCTIHAAEPGSVHLQANGGEILTALPHRPSGK